MKQITAIVILGSLVLLSGCYESPTYPDPQGYNGFLESGWDAYEVGNFETALQCFLDAIDIDPSLPGGYVGAGWASLYLPDYWRIADQYFYMAVQQQAGVFPLGDFSESQVQDTMWTTFQCIHPDLPASVLDPILENTADSGIVWVGEQIEAIVGDADMPYRFQPLNSGVIALFEIVNSYTTIMSDVDSIAGGWVYVTVPQSVLEVSDEDYYTWIGVDQQVNYEYRIFDQSGSPGGQYLLDALAGSIMLQDIRGSESGDALLGCASAFALDILDADYVFGSGQYYEGLESLSNMQVKGTGAALAFASQYFKFAWFTCMSEGQGMGLDPMSPSFVTDLMAVIETMLNS